jgi:hypothetical protein
MSMRRLVLILLVAASVVAAAACGGGGGNGGNGSERLSQEEFASKTNQICSDIEGKLNAIEQPQDLSEVAGFVDKAKSTLHDGIEQMRELSPPADRQAAFDRFLAISEQQEQLFDDLRQAAANKQLPKLQEIQKKGQGLSDRGDAAAREMGATKCTSG